MKSWKKWSAWCESECFAGERENMVEPIPPPSDSLSQMESLWFPLWHNLFYLSAYATFTLGCSMRIQGQRNMPTAGPALLIANHQSYLDPPLVGVAAKRPLVYLARKTLFRNRFFSGLIRSLNAVPIDQVGVGKEGIRTILEQLQLGKPVLVFPEGERTYTGALQPLKPGIHLLIKRVNAPIVPVGIAGAFDAWPRTRLLPIPAPLCFPAMPGSISISLGKPVDAAKFSGMPRESVLTELGELIRIEHERAERLRRK